MTPSSVLMLFAVCASLCFGQKQAEVTHSLLSPIVFLPGFSGTRLYAQIDNPTYVPTSCEDSNIPIGQPFTVIYNVSLLLKHSDCMFDLLHMNFENSTKEFSNAPGIKIFTQNFGGFSDISPVYWPFANNVEKWGYKRNFNLFGAPYDYRYMSAKSLEKIGFVTQLKELIEKAYYLNSHKRVILVGHSNGGPTMYTFLTASKLITQAWKDKYIAAMVGLSGNFLGQINMYKVFLYGGNKGEQSMITSWEASYGSATYGDYQTVSTIPVATTFVKTANERNYTTRLSDMVDLFTQNNHTDWADRLTEVYTTTMNRIKSPNVDIYCLYGTNISTDYSYVFENNINEKYIAVNTIDGDGNQDAYDNTFCNVWKPTSTVGDESNHQSTAAAEVDKNIEDNDGKPGGAAIKQYFFESTGFPNVHHMGMYWDENVMMKLKEIVDKYNA